MSREDMTEEQLERLLRDHFNEEYGDTRRPAELWRGIQPRLDRHNSLDLLPPSQRFNDAASGPERRGKRRSNLDEDWLPLPNGVRPTRPRQRSSFLPAAMVACLVVGVALAAFLLTRARDGQPEPQRIAVVPTSEQSAAIATPTAATSAQGTLVVEMAPTDWLLRGQGSYLFRTRADRTQTYSGTASAYLEPTSPTAWADVYLVKMVNRPDLAGQRVRFSAYVKAEGVRELGELWLATSDYLPRFGRFDGQLNREIKGTTGWELYEIVQDVPGDSISVSFGLRLVGQGKVWIDGAKLELVGEDVPVLTTRNLANGSFESGFAGWEISSMRNSVELDSAASSDGTSSLRLRDSKSPAEKALPEVKQTIQLSGYAGKRVRVSAYVKTENLSRWGTIYADLEERLGSNETRRLAHDDLYTRPLPQTSDWNQYSIVMDVPEGNVVLTVGAFVDGGGTMWLDNVRMEEVAEDVALTGSQILDQPTNLDFEAGLNTWLVGGTYPGGFDIGADEKGPHGGKASAYIKADPNRASATDSAGLEQWFDPSQFLDKRVRVSGFIRSSNVSRNVLFRVFAQSADLRSGNVAQLPPGTIYGRSGWQEYSLVVDVPRDSLYVSIMMSLEGQGEVWFDDLKIEVVDRSVPLTGSPGGMPIAPLGSLQYRHELAMKNGECN